MKRLLFLLLLTGLTTGWASAQTDTNPAADSTIVHQQDTSLAEDGEAGGINGAEVDTTEEKQGIAWLPILLGFAAGALVAGIIAGVAAGRKKAAPAAPPVTAPETPAAVAASRSPQDQKLKSQLNTLLKEKESLQQALDSHRSFDNEYYGEAFRKLIAPMNEAMEKGSHREIEENLMKIMAHYSSLTRYKIAKKQPYDEANIQFLLTRKNTGEGLVAEISKDTPVDKIPKHIKPLLDLLKEQGSGGLDESVIAGYRIRNL